ncbi:hypothetical protein BGW39_005732 [Mortierella sp. 14UC]|nr:hypothetical protein BGW39_005732 [Mortierella sp. 14UC]
MENDSPQVQAFRPANKDSLNSDLTTAPTLLPKKGFVLWDDIRLAFSDALYVRYQAKVMPFMKGIDFLLQPLKIAATPDVVLDVAVDGPIFRTGATIPHAQLSQTTLQESTKEAAAQEETSSYDTTSSIITATKTATIGRNPEFGPVEEAMQNYNHIDKPVFGPQPRAPQYVPGSHNRVDTNDESTESQVASNNNFAVNNKPLQSPQDHTAAVGVKDVAPLVLKATRGDAGSQVELGDMYKTGNGVEQDYEAARYWYLKAANQCDPLAQSNVGDLYRLGLGTDVDHSTALSWYQKAADQGSASGQCKLGLMYEYGLAVEMDYAVAMDCVGDFYYKGRGVPKDYSKVLDWSILSAKQNLPQAQFNLGYLYYKGRGIEKDKDVGLEWFRKSTSRRDSDMWAQYSMGYLYYHALGIPHDYSKAREWLLKSARQGCSSAQVRLARLYFRGLDVPQDYSEALM